MLAGNDAGAGGQMLEAPHLHLGADDPLEPPQRGFRPQLQRLDRPPPRGEEEHEAAHQEEGEIDVEDGVEQGRTEAAHISAWRLAASGATKAARNLTYSASHIRAQTSAGGMASSGSADTGHGVNVRFGMRRVNSSSARAMW